MYVNHLILKKIRHVRTDNQVYIIIFLCKTVVTLKTKKFVDSEKKLYLGTDNDTRLCTHKKALFSVLVIQAAISAG